MRQIMATEFGGPDVLATSTAPEPVPGPGEAVVDVAVAPVLFVETQIRRGWGRDWFPVEPPTCPARAWPDSATTSSASTRVASSPGTSMGRARMPAM
jgi:NADPH:quinone reductase-like Zn-dependent oxidoreductase